MGDYSSRNQNSVIFPYKVARCLFIFKWAFISKSIECVCRRLTPQANKLVAPHAASLGLKIDQPFSNRANCTPAAPQLKPFKGGVNDIRAILIRRQLPTLHNFLNETEKRLPLLLPLPVDDDAASPKLCGSSAERAGWLVLASAP